MKAYILWPSAVVFPIAILEALDRLFSGDMGAVLLALWIVAVIFALIGGFAFERQRDKN